MRHMYVCPLLGQAVQAQCTGPCTLCRLSTQTSWFWICAATPAASSLLVDPALSEAKLRLPVSVKGLSYVCSHGTRHWQGSQHGLSLYHAPHLLRPVRLHPV